MSQIKRKSTGNARLSALATRFRRIAELLTAECQLYYDAHGVPFEPRWFALVQHLLSRGGQASFSEALAELQITQPALSQVVRQMSQSGMLKVSVDSHDRRSKNLSLTKKAKALIPKLSPLWEDISGGTLAMIHPFEEPLADALERMERAVLEKRPLHHYRASLKDRLLATLKVETYHPDSHSEYERHFADYFSELKFREEDADREQKKYPEKLIKGGGQIFLMKSGPEELGMVVLKSLDKHKFELGKMFVRKQYRSLGLGQVLLDHAIEWCKNKQAQTIYLSTSKNLAAAIYLYKKNGFKLADKQNSTSYERAELWMEKCLSTFRPEK